MNKETEIVEISQSNTVLEQSLFSKGELEEFIENFKIAEANGERYKKFFTVEGIDGAGKTTQIKKLKNYFEKLGYKVVVTREPGGTALGEDIRQILKSKKDISSFTELMLFYTARIEHIEKVILPALSEKFTIVICDRYIDSTFAYQSFEGKNFSNNASRFISRFTSTFLGRKMPLPEKTFFIDVNVELARERILQRNNFVETQEETKEKTLTVSDVLPIEEKVESKAKIDEIERKNLNRLEYLSYLFKILQKESQEMSEPRIFLINGDKNEDEVFEEIKTALSGKVKKVGYFSKLFSRFF